jgi:pilus biogenesis lipoprotein CpaD
MPAMADKQITVAPTRSVHVVSYTERKVQPSTDEQAQLANFLNNTVAERGMAVMVERPARRADRLTRQRAEALVGWLTREGFHVHRYDAGDVDPGKVRIAVDHLVAMAPNCPNWEYHKYHEYGSQPSPNFGCADRANLAAMVANPRDLIVGQVPENPSGHGPLYGEARYRTDNIRALQDAGSLAGSD